MASRRQIAQIRRDASAARAKALAAQQQHPQHGGLAAPARAPAGMTVEEFQQRNRAA